MARSSSSVGVLGVDNYYLEECTAEEREKYCNSGIEGIQRRMYWARWNKDHTITMDEIVEELKPGYFFGMHRDGGRKDLDGAQFYMTIPNIDISERVRIKDGTFFLLSTLLGYEDVDVEGIEDEYYNESGHLVVISWMGSVNIWSGDSPFNTVCGFLKKQSNEHKQQVLVAPPEMLEELSFQESIDLETRIDLLTALSPLYPSIDSDHESHLLDLLISLIDSKDPLSPGLVAPLTDLGLCYIEDGMFEEACDVLDRSLSIQQLHWWTASNDTCEAQVRLVTTLSNLASAYGELSEWDQRLQALGRVHKVCEGMYGQCHLETIRMRVEVALAYEDAGYPGRYRLEELEDSLRIIKRFHEDEVEKEMAEMEEQRAIEEGKTCEEEMTQQMNEELLLPPKNGGEEKTATSNKKKRRRRKKHPKPEKSGPIGVDAKKEGVEGEEVDHERCLGRRPVTTISRDISPAQKMEAIQVLGLGFLDGGDVERACEVYEWALEVAEGAYGPEDERVSLILTSLGLAYIRLGVLERAKDLLERSLVMERRINGSRSTKVANVIHNLGCAYGALGNAERARDLLEEALDILENQIGPNTSEIAGVLTGLSRAYGELGQRKKKRKALERASQIKREHEVRGKRMELMDWSPEMRRSSSTASSSPSSMYYFK